MTDINKKLEDEIDEKLDDKIDEIGLTRSGQGAG